MESIWMSAFFQGGRANKADKTNKTNKTNGADRWEGDTERKG